MLSPSVFESNTTENSLSRLKKLSPTTQPAWGKMNAGQMLAHLNVAYDMAFDKTDIKVNGIARFMLKTFVKNKVVGEKPFSKNGQTAPFFVMKEDKDFEKEKQALITNIKEVEAKGKSWFEGKQSPSFGPLSSSEWSQLFQKHIEHHFEQFGI